MERKRFKIVIALVCFLQILTVNAQKNYSIEGYITGIKDSTLISLGRNDGSLIATIATDTVIGGKFRFSGKIDKAEAFMILGRGTGFPSMWLDVWVAPNTTVKITGGDKFLKTWKVESPIKQQKELNLYIEATKTELNELQRLSVSRMSLFEKLRKASPEERKQVKKDIDSLSRLQDSFNALVYQKEITLLSTSAISPIWIDKLNGLAMSVKYTHKDLRQPVIKLYNKLNNAQKESPKGREIAAYLYPPRIVKDGEPMADTLLYTLEGKASSLAQFKGKYLLLDFWSIGCGPCISAMPDLRKVSEAYKDSLTVISLSLDKKKEIWEKASAQEKISWVNLSDGNGMTGIASRYGVQGIPHYVIISPSGAVLTSWTGFREGLVEEKIKKFIH